MLLIKYKELSKEKEKYINLYDVVNEKCDKQTNELDKKQEVINKLDLMNTDISDKLDVANTKINDSVIS